MEPEELKCDLVSGFWPNEKHHPCTAIGWFKGWHHKLVVSQSKERKLQQ